jgi:hypothetical protein
MANRHRNALRLRAWAAVAPPAVLVFKAKICVEALSEINILCGMPVEVPPKDETLVSVSFRELGR